jgi:hypothetical protein
MMAAISIHDCRAFYTAALAGLRFVEARRPTARRFGPEAEARWTGFRGDLTTADRIDLLIRDADAEWPGAFGARTVFAEPAVSDDDAFGSVWSGLDSVDAEEVWRATHEPDESWDLDILAAAWSVAWGARLVSFEVGPLTAVDRLVIAGPSAIVGALRAFVGRDDLAWPEQVVVVATPPSHRQLASFATAILNATKPASLVTHVQAHGLVGRAIVSADASSEDAAVAGRSST